MRHTREVCSSGPLLRDPATRSGLAAIQRLKHSSADRLRLGLRPVAEGASEGGPLSAGPLAYAITGRRFGGGGGASSDQGSTSISKRPKS